MKPAASASEGVSSKTDVGTLASGALLAVLLYMMGMLGHKLIGLPAPVGMLFLAVLLKLANVVSPRLQEGRRWCINSSAPRSPTRSFAVGVAITPWQELVNAFTLTNLLVIVSTVSALVATGFWLVKDRDAPDRCGDCFLLPERAGRHRRCGDPDRRQPHEPDAVRADRYPHRRGDKCLAGVAVPQPLSGVI